MTSSSITSKGGNKFIGKFNVKIKGITKVVNVPFTYSESNGKGRFIGSFSLNRLNFGVGASSWMLDDNVKVKLTLSTVKN